MVLFGIIRLALRLKENMFDGKYLEWNQKRIKGIIDYYGHPFMVHKKVLDLGCGHADISGALYRLGADITAVDARQEHLKMVSKKFPGVKTVKADLDRAWPFYGKQYDLVLDLDLICHLGDYEGHLRAICSSASHIVLETAVCDSEDPYKCIKGSESKNVYDLSVNGISSYPTAAAIERVLRECGFSFRRNDTNRFNSGSFVYDWQPSNNDRCDVNKRRIWFAVKDTSQHNQVFIPHNAPPPAHGHNHVPALLQSTHLPTSGHKSDPRISNPPQLPVKGPAKSVKTALCISGHLRTFEENFQSIKNNILDRLDCDVFIHTWDILGLSYRFTDAELHNTETGLLLNKIKQLYNPRKIVIEKTKNFPVKPIMQARLIDHRDIPGILSMYYKVEACNDLKREYEKEHGFTYDCVIRFRGDLYAEQPIPIDERTNLNYLYLPAFGNFGGACDQFAFGNSSVMDKYSTLYSNMEVHLHNGAPFHPEKLLLYHIEKQGLPIAKVNFKYVIKRANGLVQDNMLLERALGFVR
jgi:SAM-dependent methyltransferase